MKLGASKAIVFFFSIYVYFFCGDFEDCLLILFFIFNFIVGIVF